MKDQVKSFQGKIQASLQKKIRECQYNGSVSGQKLRFQNYQADVLSKHLTPFVYDMIKRAASEAFKERK